MEERGNKQEKEVRHRRRWREGRNGIINILIKQKKSLLKNGTGAPDDLEREWQWGQRQKGQFALSHSCFYSLPLKEPKRKTLWKYLLPKAYYSITLAHCLVYNSRGEKSFPLESCKMLVTDEIRVKHSCFPEHHGGPCHAML